jgi:hypothetical protein
VSGFSPARCISILFSGQFSKIKSGSSLKGAFMPRIKWPLYILLALFTVVVGCESEDDSDSSSSGSVVPGVVDANGGFNVKINNPTGTNHYVHKDGDFEAPCMVASNETSFANQDITCIVEIEELAGANTGVKMVLNAPPGMCKYVWHKPYYYFGLNYGVGPNAGTVRFDKEGTFVGGSVTGPGYLTAAGEIACDYDYTPAEGPNCCYGSYSKTTVNNFGSVDPEFPVTSTTETVSWTGKPGNCAAGSGAGTAPRDTQLNLPVGQYFPGTTGFNKEFDTGQRAIIDNDSSLYYANYYTGTAPTALKQAGTYPGNPYYTWICFDDAEETVARIRVQIREWNEDSEFELEAAGDPDTSGTEPNWGTPVNDFPDWLDIVTTYSDIFPGMPE